MSWSRAVLHVDMDAFYVNVHLLDHAGDADIPLAVGGRPEERGVVTSASYEARRFGVHSAMPMAVALRLVPHLKVVPPDWSRIRECSHWVMEVLARYGPMEKMSVDEAYIDLSETAERLAGLGITTCGELAAADLDRLRAVFGREGEKMAQRARGEDDRPVEPNRGPPKSISQEWTFNRDVADAAVLRDHLEKMSAEVAEQLQKRGLVAHTVRVKFRWSDFTTFTRQRSVEVGTDEAATIFRLAEAIWRENWPAGRPMRLLGVGATSLVEGAGRQLGLL